MTLSLETRSTRSFQLQMLFLFVLRIRSPFQVRVSEINLHSDYDSLGQYIDIISIRWLRKLGLESRRESQDLVLKIGIGVLTLVASGRTHN